jgi:hypothetical protein
LDVNPFRQTYRENNPAFTEPFHFRYNHPLSDQEKLLRKKRHVQKNKKKRLKKRYARLQALLAENQPTP